MSFEEIKRKAKEKREAQRQSKNPLIFVGTATCGRSAGAMDTLEIFRQELRNFNIDAAIIQTGCLGLCYAEPLISIVKPGRPNIWYRNVTPERAKEIVEGYLVKDDILADYALGSTEGSVDGIPSLFELPTLKPQVRRVLLNCGFIDPTNIDDYIASDGYEALQKALFEMDPEKVINEVKLSGLRGLGGAGFPTGRKWEACRRAHGDEKYIICNADEGDPGAFQDRSVLEGDPHSIMEGMIIAGYAVGARKGYIYVRAEYPLAVEGLETAIAQAKEKGILGENILDSNFSFDLEIFQGAGAFVCGESTALTLSIEGNRGMPLPLPRPRTTEEGLWSKPTVLNNVKTFANIRWIINKGADWFASIGTDKSKGTAIFSLTGKLENCGLIEVPMGITLREIIFDIGAGIPGGKAFKAVQTGGPSGGCLAANMLDTPVDFDSLATAGSIMGSGGMVVADEDTCMVDLARYFLDFTQKESCGQCSLCRLGSPQMLEILNTITEGKGKIEDIELLMELGEAIKTGSICGLGKTVPNPVLTTLRYFREEYEAHILEKKCPARVCRALISYRILPDRCKACMICLRNCPVEAIRGAKKEVHVIDQDKCIRCGLCISICPERFSAVECIPGRLTEGDQK
ncbi:MAG: NADH-quinone oxidoreductase subunit NuoF [Chloroflexota bacterium]|nr:NADH-quinone oxidoreductase subunit NuoF [Chloroflexota bacterium]